MRREGSQAKEVAKGHGEVMKEGEDREGWVGVGVEVVVG